ncbi:P-loop containing nucleoside triphosphate hydrolase protein [Aureobasidium subglaciale]|nr:P-loop containing nucleoside triphosphate hydrolase protein [Aureobasidium subglaciale]
MDYTYGLMALRAHNVHATERRMDASKRVIIALAGPPGSGKSTAAEAVVDRLNKNHDRIWAQVLPMDGFHYPRHTLDMMPNKDEAYARRGADWTFDAPKLLDFLQNLRQSSTKSSAIIWAPRFDHASKDPTEEAIEIGPHISLVILEGSWLLLDEEPWIGVSAMVDDTWFIDVDPALARMRIAQRHVRAGIEQDLIKAFVRADGNDMVNGEKIRTRMVKPKFKVHSIEAHHSSAPWTVATNPSPSHQDFHDLGLTSNYQYRSSAEPLIPEVPV